MLVEGKGAAKIPVPAGAPTPLARAQDAAARYVIVTCDARYHSTVARRPSAKLTVGR